jgi:hypothetical protein
VNKPAKSKKVQKSKNKNKNQDSPSLVIPNIVNTKIVVGRIKNL